MAEKILLNAKTQRPGVCNAAEQLLVHAGAAEELLPRLARALTAKGVQLRCDTPSAEILARAGVAHTPAQPADFKTEFLGLVMGVRVVDSLETAIATINRDGSAHTDAIVTSDETAARRFQAAVDSAVVLWNASTRFNDGFEFGYGAEIGISTDRLHARGPMGLRELCSHKFVIDGTGQVRAASRKPGGFRHIGSPRCSMERNAPAFRRMPWSVLKTASSAPAPDTAHRSRGVRPPRADSRRNSPP
jgi:glutamate-5-semialdehyde dehydrogenase